MRIHRLYKNNHNYEINIYILEAIFNTKDIYETNNMKNMKKYLPDNKISIFPWQTESSLGLSVKFISLLFMSSLIILILDMSIKSIYQN